jgi:hypothetical protein
MGARDQRPEYGSLLQHDQRPCEARSPTDQQLAFEDVHEVIAPVPVALDDDVRVVAAQDDHPFRGPLEELLVDRNATLAVALSQHLLPCDVALVDEGEAWDAFGGWHAAALAPGQAPRQGGRSVAPVPAFTRTATGGRIRGMRPRTGERACARRDVAARIAARTEERVHWHATYPGAIVQRLDALEREWDVERTLQANAATISLLGLLLGAVVDRRFFAIPGLVALCSLQHAVQGWCPPLPLLRRLGVRTQREIDEERCALKALRGDFATLRPSSDAGAAAHALDAARA